MQWKGFGALIPGAFVTSLIACGGTVIDAEQRPQKKTSDDAGAELRGSEGRRCYPNDTCNSGLSCVAGLCAKSARGAGGTSGNTGGSRTTGAAGVQRGSIGAGGALRGNGGSSAGGRVGSGGFSGTAGFRSSGGFAGGSGGFAGGSGGFVGDASVSGSAGSSYVCSERPSQDPGGTGKVGAICCSGVGVCEDPATLPGAGTTSLGHDTCAPTLLCAPLPTALPETCTSRTLTSLAEGLEGRCINQCLLIGSPLVTLLDHGDDRCSSPELCMPCYDPADGTSTGACNRGTDAPLKVKPAPYATCPKSPDANQPQGGGLCVPRGVLDKLSDTTHPLYNPSIPSLHQDNCAAGEACVPARKAANPAYCSQHCDTATQLTQIDPAVYRNGACTPTFVVYDTNGNAGVQLVSGSGATACGSGELCSPCANPLTNGTPSGACY